MIAFLRPFLFFELLSTGSFLECETCFATNSSCEGGMERCDDGQDTCAISLHETSEGGETMLSVAKACYSSDVCESRPISVTFGKGKFIRSNVICCQRDACLSASPQLPPRNTTANGKRCPGCHSQSKACPAGVVNCTGEEDQCLNLMGHTYAGKNVTLRGCTTQSICAGLQSGQSDLLALGAAEARIDCRQASQASLPSESHLLPLFWLLFMKMLL